MLFGEFIKEIRQNSGKSLRAAAAAINVSAQYYSTVERGKQCAFTHERLAKLSEFLDMTNEESDKMYNLASMTYKTKNVIVPQDIAQYIMERPYVIDALRFLKKINADEQDWARMLEILHVRKGLSLK